MATKITINGQEYDSPEQMPPDVRKIYDGAMALGGPLLADQDGNGIPDVLEGKGGLSLAARVVKSILVNGRPYQSLEEMPPDVRQLYQQAMEKANPGGSGVKIHSLRVTPTFAFRMGRKSPFGDTPSARDVPGAPRPIEPGGVEAGVRTLLVIAALVLAAAAGWYWMAHR